MSQITLTKKLNNNNYTYFNIDLENEETNETEKYRYKIKRLGGTAAMKVQLLSAEFARDKKRDEIVGSSMLKQILDFTEPVGEAPDLIDLFDFVDDDGLTALVKGLIESAQSSTVGDITNDEPAAPKGA